MDTRVGNDFKTFIENDVACVCDFSINQGEPAIELELCNGDHLWTSILVKQPKPVLDEPSEPVRTLKTAMLLE